MNNSLMEQEVVFHNETPSGILFSRPAEDVAMIWQIYIEKLLMVF